MDILKTLQSIYEEWAMYEEIDTGVKKNNECKSVEDLCQYINQNTYSFTEGSISVTDIEICFPSHNIETSNDKTQFQKPSFIYKDDKGNQWFSEENTTLHLMKTFVNLIFYFQQLKNRGQEVILCTFQDIHQNGNSEK